MKNIVALCVFMLTCSIIFSQERVITWEIGDPTVTCTDSVQICYPVNLTIGDTTNTPELALSTYRFFYDGGLLSAFNIQNLVSAYEIIGLSESNDVFGGVLGFTGGGGIFTQMNVNPTSTVGRLLLSGTPAKLMDLCFTLDTTGGGPFCASILQDNNFCGWNMGPAEDAGYLPGSGGIVSGFTINQVYNSITNGDDEVVNYLYDTTSLFDCLIDELDDTVGVSVMTGCVDPPCLVPVEFLTFQADKRELEVDLLWQTANEIDNEYFVIERSFDGRNFRPIGRVNGNGTVFTTSTYTFTDKAPVEQNYYRLKQVDFDGQFAYSDIRLVTFSTEEKRLEVFPNPFVNELHFKVEGVINYGIEILNAAGQTIIRQENFNNQTLKVNDFAEGVYLVKLYNADGQEIYAEKFVKIK